MFWKREARQIGHPDRESNIIIRYIYRQNWLIEGQTAQSNCSIIRTHWWMTNFTDQWNKERNDIRSRQIQLKSKMEEGTSN